MMGRALRVLLFLRVSDAREHLENQEGELRLYAERQGWTIARIVRLGDSSAYKGAHLKALEELYRAAHKREFDVILLWALDRLDRRGVSATLGVLSRLESSGVRVISLQEPWLSVEGPLRELMLSILAWAARFESERKGERVKVGMARAKAEGKAVGRPAVADKVDAKLVAAMRADGKSWAQIAKAHPPVKIGSGRRVKPSVGTIRRAVAASEPGSRRGTLPAC